MLRLPIKNITLRTLPVKRSAGQSAVAGAAYGAGERLADRRKGKVADYSARASDVWHKEILAPDVAPKWAFQRELIWNAAEAAERRKDGRPARDVTLGLPWEMTRDEHEALARSFVQKEFVAKGHVVDLCFHKYGKRVTDTAIEGRSTLRRWAANDIPFLERGECEELHSPHIKIERDRDGGIVGYKIFQPHAHAYVTPRAITTEGFGSKRNREFDRNEQTMEWRYEWPKHVNANLEEAGYDFRVSATADEADAELPLKPDEMPLASYHIELDGKESVVREERDLNAVHNDAVRSAAHTKAAEEAGQIEPQAKRFERVQAWWRSMRERFQEFGANMKERAQSLFQRREEAEEPEQQETPKLKEADEQTEQRESDNGGPSYDNSNEQSGPER